MAKEPYKILIAGGSGPLGKSIAQALNQKGYLLRFLSVSKEDPAKGIYKWNPEKGFIDERAFEGAQVIINLSGAGVADQRWTRARKQTITESRVKSTQLLADYVLRHAERNIRFISASAIGYYPAQDSERKTEKDGPGSGFLAQVCQAWEAEALRVADVSVVRIGVVLSREGGFLEKMRPLAALHLLSAMGNGQQMISWIHEEDVANIFVSLTEGQLAPGIYNAVSPYPVSNKTLIQTFAKLSDSKFWAPPVPAFLIRLLFGEMANETVFSDQNISPARLTESGFTFKYPKIEQALQTLIL